MPTGEPVMEWMSKNGKSEGPARLRIKRYEVNDTHSQSKRLRRRLSAVLDKKGNTWGTTKYFDPPDNTRMHRPGSQKKR